MNDFTFSRASSVEDFKQISEINAQHLDCQEDSFLIIALDMDEVENLVSEKTVDFYIAKDDHGSIYGYVEVTNEFDKSLMNDIRWKSNLLQSKTIDALAGEHVNIKQLAVRRGIQNQGIGSFLYSQVEKKLGLPIIAFVAETPRLNEPSLRFHIKYGFTAVGMLYRAQFGKFTNYASRMFVKF